MSGHRSYDPKCAGFAPRPCRKYLVTPGQSFKSRAGETIANAALSELRHNLRTPVNHILGYSEMLIEDATEARNTVVVQALRDVHATAHGALGDINSMLSNRESVPGEDVDALYERIRPRVERIQRCVTAAREAGTQPEWSADLDRIAHGASALLELFGETVDEETETAPQVVEAAKVEGSGPRILVSTTMRPIETCCAAGWSGRDTGWKRLRMVRWPSTGSRPRRSTSCCWTY